MPGVAPSSNFMKMLQAKKKLVNTKPVKPMMSDGDENDASPSAMGRSILMSTLKKSKKK